MSQIAVKTPTLTKDEIQQKFNKLLQNHLKICNSNVKERKSKLDKLHKAILKYRPQIKEAMYQDFRKHPSEVDLTEVYPITSEIKHAKRHLRRWMADHSVQTPVALLGSSSYIKYEPKGVVLIVSPWNFPFNLTFGPVIAAVAAGNAIMIKPSEHTPHSSALMNKIISEVFAENEVTVVEGNVETAQRVLELPFNHIFFTGAPSIGKIVMKAASQHLTSVTLELGGKSPTIVDETANIEMAARRIAWGKFLNNGQVCIAPDYVFVHRNIADKFMDAVAEHIKKFYSEDASQESSYARMVNDNHYERVKGYVKEAVANGAAVKAGNKFNDEENYIAPTVLSNVTPEMDLMQNEIFGPVLPVHTFDHLDEVIDAINSREKPLALYIYSKNKRNINKLLDNTRAGGGCINHSAIHFFNNNLPFGGSNNSGIGKGHGYFGFQAFSNPRGILKQHLPNAVELLMPPYNNFKQKLIDFTIKWF